MAKLRDMLDDGDQQPVVPHEEIRLFLRMRDRIHEGATVRFKTDHRGELIAIEEVLHRARNLREDVAGSD